MDITRRTYLGGMGAALGAGVLGTEALAQEKLPGLASTLIWSVYDVGASGYVEASAVADAMGKKYGTRVRLQPSGTSIGRLLPLKQRRATHGWLATEVYFASEALYEYASPDWGPQDLRTLLGRVNTLSIAVTEKSGIKTFADLKGKRYAIAKANTSVNAKVEPLFAAAGISLNDMQLVEFPSYGATMKALIEGKADAAAASPHTTTLKELEASPNGIGWIELHADNKDLWAKFQKALPLVAPYHEEIGAGITGKKPIWMMGFRYPMITVYSDAKDDVAARPARRCVAAVAPDKGGAWGRGQALDVVEGRRAGNATMTGRVREDLDSWTVDLGKGVAHAVSHRTVEVLDVGRDNKRCAATVAAAPVGDKVGVVADNWPTLAATLVPGPAQDSVPAVDQAEVPVQRFRDRWAPAIGVLWDQARVSDKVLGNVLGKALDRELKSTRCGMSSRPFAKRSKN